MVPETFEQVLIAAQAAGSFTPAWKKFVNTKFFVPVIRSADEDPAKFTLRIAQIAQNGGRSILISEVRERLDQPVSGLASLSGAQVVRLLQADASILVALSGRAFSIAKEQVEWLKRSVEAAQARSKARAAERTRAAPAAGGSVDVGALKPRRVSLARIGLSFLVPGAWSETQDAKALRFSDGRGATVEASGYHHPHVSIEQWVGMRLSLLEHEMGFLKQDGAPYAIDGEAWSGRVQGMALEFTGIFPGEAIATRYLLACLRIDGTLASVAIRAPAAAFEQDRALYRWLLGRIDLVQANK